MSSFVQKKVEVLAFDLQRQHRRNLTSVAHTRNLVQGNSEVGSVKPKGAWLASVTCYPLPRSTTENANQRDQLFFFWDRLSYCMLATRLLYVQWQLWICDLPATTIQMLRWHLCATHHIQFLQCWEVNPWPCAWQTNILPTEPYASHPKRKRKSPVQIKINISYVNDPPSPSSSASSYHLGTFLSINWH